LLWSSETDLAYCANYDGYVTVIAGYGSIESKVIPVGHSPFAFAYSTLCNRLYVGHLNNHRVFVIRDTVTGIDEPAHEPRPTAVAFSAHPTVFRGRVRMFSNATEARNAALNVHSLSGALVAQLAPVVSRRGQVEYVWDGRDRQGREVMPGVYMLHIAGSETEQVKVVKMQ